jgi:hypothetical protein
MRVSLFFILRKDSDTPELMAAADEYTNDENPGYLEGEIKSAKKSVGEELLSCRTIEVDLDDAALSRLLVPVTSMSVKSVRAGD